MCGKTKLTEEEEGKVDGQEQNDKERKDEEGGNRPTDCLLCS